MIDCAKKGKYSNVSNSKNNTPFIGIDKTIASIIDIMNFKVIDSKLRVFNVGKLIFPLNN